MTMLDATRRVGGAAAMRWLLLAILLPACASSGGGAATERFRHGEHGYSLAPPVAVEDVAWRSVDLADAAVAYRGPNAAWMALSSNCTQAKHEDPATLGRQLLVGISDRERLESESFDFADGQAFRQLVESRGPGRRVRTRTVTLVRGDCVLDWVLAVPVGQPAVEQSFESWWRGLEFEAVPVPQTQLGQADR